MPTVQWHVVYTEHGKVRAEYFDAPASFAAAEEEFQRLHPDASYWEIGW